MTRDGGKSWSKVLCISTMPLARPTWMCIDAPNTLFAAIRETPDAVALDPRRRRRGAPQRRWRQDVAEGRRPAHWKCRSHWSRRQSPKLRSSDGDRRKPEPANRRHAAARRCVCCELRSWRRPAPACRRTDGQRGLPCTDGGRTWRKTHGDGIDVAGSKAPYSFNQIRTNPSNPDQIIVISDRCMNRRTAARRDLQLHGGCSETSGRSGGTTRILNE